MSHFVLFTDFQQTKNYAVMAEHVAFLEEEAKSTSTMKTTTIHFTGGESLAVAGGLQEVGSLLMTKPQPAP